MCEWFQVVESSLQKLDCDPTGIEEFLEHFTFLSALSSKMSALEKEYSAVAHLYSVLRYHQIIFQKSKLPHTTSFFPSLVN